MRRDLTCLASNVRERQMLTGRERGMTMKMMGKGDQQCILRYFDIEE